MQPIPQTDLKAQYLTIKDEIDQAMRDVVESTQFIRGQAVKDFETAFARFCTTKHAVGVGNGTDALMLALRALGIGEGDEVITPAFTFTATAEAVYWVGAKTIFVDIVPDTYTIDVGQIESRMTERTKAIIPVHLYGHPADMDAILEVAARHDLLVLEDAAQAHGAHFKGRRVGSIGHAASFSFYPGKNLGAYGDAGAVVTNRKAIDLRIRKLGDHGSLTKYENDELGFNSRLDSVQAAVLNVKLKYLDEWNRRRRAIAHQYNEIFQEVPGIVLPAESEWAEPVYHLYVIQVNDRDTVKSRLHEFGIGAGVHYPKPLHLQKAYAFLGHRRGEFPVAESAAERVLSLPNYPEMSAEMVLYVADKVKESLSA